MPKIGNEKSYAENRCNRCGSKRKVTKTWTEKVKNVHSDGYMVLYHTQTSCTNKECSAKFEELERKEREKRELRLDKNKKTGIVITKSKSA